VSNQRDNADAFDDLLGQLVDELAMTPTMEPEPEPEPEPPPPPVVVAPPQEYASEAPPQKQSNVLAIALGRQHGRRQHWFSLCGPRRAKPVTRSP